MTRYKNGLPIQKKFSENDKYFLWAIDPERSGILNCIGLSQIGWTPNATKLAVYNSAYDNSSVPPDFTVTKNGETVLSGQAAKYIDASGSDTKYQLKYYIVV
jgi:hypothetical protein